MGKQKQRPSQDKVQSTSPEYISAMQSGVNSEQQQIK